MVISAIQGVKVNKHTKVTKASEAECNILGMAPSQDASDHQDYYISSRESQSKPLFATGILGRGHTQGISSLKNPWREKQLLLSEASKLQRETSQVNQFYH